MDKILEAFRPYIDADPDLDIVWSSKLGYICVDNSGYDLWCKLATDRVELLTVISSWFFDRAETDMWSDTADEAMSAMDPILTQLPDEDRVAVETIMGLYRKFEEELDNL